MKTIGLTGGIASGKSLIGSWFEDEGIPVYDADRIYKSLAAEGEVLYNEIIKSFGEDYLKPDGAMDWQALGRHVFSDDEARERLNAVTHPAVRRRLEAIRDEEKNKGTPIIVLSVPLLYEAGFDDLADVVVVVYVDASTQIKRLMARDAIDRDTARKKINAQMPLDIKRSLADLVIDNSGTPVATRKRFDQVLGLLRSET